MGGGGDIDGGGGDTVVPVSGNSAGMSELDVSENVLKHHGSAQHYILSGQTAGSHANWAETWYVRTITCQINHTCQSCATAISTRVLQILSTALLFIGWHRCIC